MTLDPKLANVTEVVAGAIDNIKEDDGLIRLSTGVVLNAFQANPTNLIQVMTADPRPQPPTYFSKEMGREMENSEDPDYIKRVQDWERRNTNTMLNAMVALGTSLKSTPKGFPKPEDDSWLETREALNMRSMPNNKTWRYMTWVLTIAAKGDADLKLITETVGKLSGVREADVKAAEEFPGSDG